jgi:hypothetical protein
MEEVISITIEMIVMLILGVLGNIIADRLDLSPTIVVLIMIVSLILFIFAKIKSKGTVFSFKSIVDFFYSRLVNIFLMAMLIGLILSLLCFKYLSNDHFLLIAFVDKNMFSISSSKDFISFGPGKLRKYRCWIWDYELSAYGFFFLITYLFSLSTQVLSKIVTFCLGISIGVTTSLLLFASSENQLIFTLLFWVIIMMFCLAIVSSANFKGIIDLMFSNKDSSGSDHKKI